MCKDREYFNLFKYFNLALRAPIKKIYCETPNNLRFYPYHATQPNTFIDDLASNCHTQKIFNMLSTICFLVVKYLNLIEVSCAVMIKSCSRIVFFLFSGECIDNQKPIIHLPKCRCIWSIIIMYVYVSVCVCVIHMTFNIFRYLLFLTLPQS